MKVLNEINKAVKKYNRLILNLAGVVASLGTIIIPTTASVENPYDLMN